MSRSFSRSQADLKGYHSAVAGMVPPPLYKRAQESEVSARSACSVARTSIHMMALRRALPFLSMGTTVMVVAS